MKKLVLVKVMLFILLVLAKPAPAQLLMTMEVKEPIPGTCMPKPIYAIFSGFKGQIEPVPPKSKEEIQSQLRKEVKFLVDNQKFKGEILIGCIINCKGEMVRCQVSNNSGNEELDSQILTIFKTFLKWSPGKLNGETVDCSELFRVKIKKGKLTLC